jgi:hypothetical protein
MQKVYTFHFVLLFAFYRSVFYLCRRDRSDFVRHSVYAGHKRFGALCHVERQRMVRIIKLTDCHIIAIDFLLLPPDAEVSLALIGVLRWIWSFGRG